jgi:hypothetical protein
MHSMTEGIFLILGRSHAFGKSVQVYALHIYRECGTCPTCTAIVMHPGLVLGFCTPEYKPRSESVSPDFISPFDES